METKTGVKIFLLILVALWILFVIPIIIETGTGSTVGDIAILLLGIIMPIGLVVAFIVSITNDFKKVRKDTKDQVINEANISKKISLKRKILNIVAQNKKPLSVYDFMIKIQESEEKIEYELDQFAQKGLAEKIINENGLTLYKFNLIQSDNDV